MISEFLFLEKDATKDEKSNYVALKIEIRELLKNDFNRNVLSEILLDLRKDISGDTQQVLFKLYQDLGLHHDAFAKLSSWRWQVISKGILELTQMEVAESYGFITKFINDKRSTIRKQAEIATVTLKHEGIGFFLDTTKYRISEWQQLKLLDVIRNKEDFQPPRFKAWLTSNNKYVVLFALRLIKYYNQNDANTSLVQLVKHRNNQIKIETIACIKEFNVVESLDTLKLVFWNCSTDVKIAILDTIGYIGSEGDIEFLSLIDKKELNFSVKSKALSSINVISPESIMPTKGIQRESGYIIPDDITEVVAKIHAKKHAELTGYEKEQHVNEEMVKKEALPIELNKLAKAEDSNDTNEIQNEKAENLNVNDAITNISLTKEVETIIESDLPKMIQEIEVIGEEIVLPTEIITTDLETDVREISHTNFLPLVIEEEKIEKEQIFQKLDTESLFDIRVDYEELVSSETAEHIVNEHAEELSSFLAEFDMSELAFLPLVTDGVSKNKNSRKDKLAMEKEELNQIWVEYNEVPFDLPVNAEKETLESASEYDLKLNHELKNIEIEDYMEDSFNMNYDHYQTDNIRELSVIYERVLSKDEKIELAEIEVVKPFVFGVEDIFQDTLEVSLEKETEEDNEIALPVENEQLQKIIDDLVAFDSKSQEEDIKIDDSYINPDWDLDVDQLSFIPVSFEKEEEQTESFIKIEKSKNDRNDDNLNIQKASIPKAIFGDIEFEASTRHLLNDLEEMGDQREIPFLKELLSHGKYDIFKERINNLIDTFNHSEDNDEIENPSYPFSVFQDLFRTCDNEAKLILLNEVVAVGDQKEVQFLEELAKDDSPEIRSKALEALNGLKTKIGSLEKKSNLEVSVDNQVSQSIASFESIKASDHEPTSDPDDIFDLNFDFEGDLNEYGGEENEIDMEQEVMSHGSFFSQICSFSNKIIDKLNG